MLPLIFLFLISFLICLFFSFFLKITFTKIKHFQFSNLVKEKDNRFIPIVGGLGIYLCFLLLLLTIMNFWGIKLKDLSIIYGTLIGGGAIILIGILDDIKELSPLLKLMGQILTAVIAVLFSIHTQIIYVPHGVNLVITVIWIVTIINAFNLLDILDGLATGLGLIASLVFFLLSWLTGNYMISWICLILSGSLFAFLIFNFPPAKMYLGDMGSMFIGYILSIIALKINYAPENHQFALIAPVLVLGLPIYDLIFVSFRRIIFKKSVIVKSNDHFVFQLIKRGFSLKKVLFIMYSLSFLFGVVAIAITIFVNKISLGFFITFLIIFFIVNKSLLRGRKNSS